MRMMNVRSTFIAKILILHRVQAIDWIQELRCRHQWRQLLKWLIIHSHQVVVRHRFAFYVHRSFCEWEMKALFEKHFFRVKNYKRGKSEASRERFFYVFQWRSGRKKSEKWGVCVFCSDKRFLCDSFKAIWYKNFTKKWGFESKFPICKSSKCYIFDHRKNKITVDLRILWLVHSQKQELKTEISWNYRKNKSHVT